MLDDCMSCRPHTIDGKEVDTKRAMPKSVSKLLKVSTISLTYGVTKVCPPHSYLKLKKLFWCKSGLPGVVPFNNILCSIYVTKCKFSLKHSNTCILKGLEIALFSFVTGTCLFWKFHLAVSFVLLNNCLEKEKFYINREST